MREMKDSGLEWIGEIPNDWEAGRINALYEERNVTVSDVDYPPLSVTKLGIVPQLDTAAKTDNGENRKLIKKNDFVINSRSDRRGSCGISEYDGSCSLINTVLKPRRNMVNSYYNFVFRSERFADEFYKWGNGIVDDLWSTKWSSMKKIYVPVPSVVTQHRIADYLDAKCAQIDRVIARQQEAIERLKEYKLLKINEVLANVSENVCHLGYVGNFKNGLNFNSTTEGVVTKFLGVGDFKDQFVINKVDMLSDVITTEPIPREYILENNDIVFVRSNGSKELVGRSLMVRDIEVPVSFSGFCIRFRNQRQEILNPNYLLYFFRSPGFRKQLEILSNGSNINNINQVMLSKVEIRFPSLEQQTRIVEFFDIFTVKIDKAISQKEQMISKLTEYKKSLIYEVVTGKREV